MNLTKKPIFQIFIFCLIAVCFLMFHDIFIRERGYGKPIPLSEHKLVVENGDIVRNIVRNGIDLTKCKIMYQSLFDGKEKEQTLVFYYAYIGPLESTKTNLVNKYKDDVNACQPGDTFRTDFYHEHPNNHYLIKNDLYRMAPL